MFSNSEEELAGAYIRTVTFDNDINITKRYLYQNEYSGYGIK